MEELNEINKLSTVRPSRPYFDSSAKSWLSVLERVSAAAVAASSTDASHDNSYKKILVLLDTYNSGRSTLEEVWYNIGQVLRSDTSLKDNPLLSAIDNVLPMESPCYLHGKTAQDLEAIAGFIRAVKKKSRSKLQELFSLLTGYETGRFSSFELCEKVMSVFPPDLSSAFSALVGIERGIPENNNENSQIFHHNYNNGNLKSENLNIQENITTLNIVPKKPTDPIKTSFSFEELRDLLNSPVAFLRQSNNSHVTSTREVENSVVLFHRIFEGIGNVDIFTHFIKVVTLFMRGCLSLAEVLKAIEHIFPMDIPQLPYEFKTFLSNAQDEARRQTSIYTTPLSQLNYDGCRREGLSYLELPLSFQKLWCSGREYEDPNVTAQLNDDFVSLPRGSEDDSFRHLKRNAFEEAMFRMEDEMFELDVMIGTIQSCLSTLEPLEQEKLKLSQNFRHNFRLKEPPFSILHIKSFARVYGDHAADVLELFRRSPGYIIGPLIERFQEKLRNWCTVKDMLSSGIWKDIAIKNFYKQFEHRLYYLKALDRHILTMAGMETQALGLYYYRRHRTLPVDLSRKLRHLLKKIIHQTAGFPGCPYLSKSGENSLFSQDLLPVLLLNQHPENCKRRITVEENKDIVTKFEPNNVYHSIEPEFQYECPTGEDQTTLHNDILKLLLIMCSKLSPTTAGRVEQFFSIFVQFLFQTNYHSIWRPTDNYGFILHYINDYDHNRDIIDSGQLETVFVNKEDKNIEPIISRTTEMPQHDDTNKMLHLMIDHPSIKDKELGIDDMEQDNNWKEFIQHIFNDPQDHITQDWKTIIKQIFDSESSVILKDIIQENNIHSNLSANHHLESQNILFVTNDQLYGLIRLYATIYERLSLVKQLITQRHDPTHPDSRLSWSIDDQIINKRVTYREYVDDSLIPRFSASELNQELFEDELRIAAGNDGIVLATLGTLLSAVVKQATIILTDVQSIKLFLLYLAYQPMLSTSALYNEYQMVARALIGPMSSAFYIHLTETTCHIWVQTSEDYSVFLEKTFSKYSSLNNVDHIMCNICHEHPRYWFRMQESGVIHYTPLYYYCRPGQHVPTGLLRLALGHYILRHIEPQVFDLEGLISSIQSTHGSEQKHNGAKRYRKAEPEDINWDTKKKNPSCSIVTRTRLKLSSIKKLKIESDSEKSETLHPVKLHDHKGLVFQTISPNDINNNQIDYHHDVNCHNTTTRLRRRHKEQRLE